MIEKYLEKLEFNIIKTELQTNCSTFGGKQLASQLQPYTTDSDVQSALAETSQACSLIHVAGYFPLPNLDDLTMVYKRIESRISLNSKQLLDIASILKAASELKKYYKTSNLQLPNIGNIFDELYENSNIQKQINSAIISEDEISDNASTKLKQIRASKRRYEAEIKTKLNTILHSNTYSKYIMDPVITIRNSRYVIPVKSEYRSKINGFIHDTSASGATVYIEPMAIFDINNSINNLTNDEAKEIELILANLSKLLYPLSGFIKNNITQIEMLDFISAKALYSIKNDCSCPQIGSFIELKNARHPLIDKSTAVPTSIELGKPITASTSISSNTSSDDATSVTINQTTPVQDSNMLGKTNFSTLVITGPNTGGKTVTLKTVGLLCAMAQSGLHIPTSEGSTIKVFDNIFADIGDEQSIEQSLSTFSAHMTNIVQILNTYTENSLILLDELGSGTDPVEGANLAISLLEEFHNNNALTIATTHYSEIKEYCLTHPGYENASCEFDVKTLKPTYHLILGVPGKSNAFAICKQLGVSEEIIKRAANLISEPDTQIEDLIKQIYDNKKESEQNKNQTQHELEQAKKLREDLEKQNNEKLKKEKEKIEEAKKEAQQILLNAKSESDKIIKRLNKLAKTYEEYDSNNNSNNILKEANRLRNNLNSRLSSTKSDGLNLSVLLQLNNKDAATLSTPASTQTARAHISNKKAKNINTEINLLGLTVDEAIAELDVYIDQARMAHLESIRIVHGKGTGKLREGVQKYLSQHKHVKSYRIADYGEGDYGVTIAYLK